MGRLTWGLIPFALAQLIAVASAQASTSASSLTTSFTRSTTTAPPSSKTSSTSSSRPPQTFTVEVGAGGFFYKPASLTNVNVNDTVEFQFYPPDHSVARAAYNNPCVPYESNGFPGQGFFSGVQNVTDDNNLKTWSLLINSTEPIFYYCTAAGSCINYQMVGVINPNSTETLETQQVAAKNAPFMVPPGGTFPAEASSSTAAATSAAATATTSPAPAHHSSKLSGGAIAGIVIGAIALLGVCAALFFFVGRTKSLKEMVRRHDATVAKPTPMASPGTDFDGSSPPYVAQSPFSIPHHQAGFPPGYQPVDTHPAGWATPPQHMSIVPAPYQEEENKPDEHRAEMPSPPAHRQQFTAELEAPIKSPRGYP